MRHFLYIGCTHIVNYEQARARACVRARGRGRGRARERVQAQARARAGAGGRARAWVRARGGLVPVCRGPPLLSVPLPSVAVLGGPISEAGLILKPVSARGKR